MIVLGCLFGGVLTGAILLLVIPRQSPRVAAVVPAKSPAQAEAESSAMGDDGAEGMMAPSIRDADATAMASLSTQPPDPALNSLVTQESHNYGQSPAKVPSLTAVHVEQRAPRSPREVAGLIDAEINRKLEADKLTAAPLCNDAEFLRRASLDLIGMIPTASKVRTFLAATPPDKRAKLIDELLDDPRYGEHFANTWHDLLLKRDPDNNKVLQSHPVFLKWMAHQFNTNRPWTKTVQSMLTASGNEALVGETFFVRANTDNQQPSPQKIVGTAAALFLGNQLMCSECHIHPVNPEWSQQDFWGLAAFFAGTRAKYSGDAKQTVVRLARIADEAPAKRKGAGASKGGGIPIPDPRNDGKFIGVAQPRLLGTRESVRKADVTRETVAEWFTADENPYFPRATVNRLWATFFARGLINPLDDLRPDNSASHPEIVELLAAEAIACHYDLKHLIRCLCLTETYQRTSNTSDAKSPDESHFSHMALKVLPPRSLFLSLQSATGGKVSLPVDVSTGLSNRDDTGQGMAFFDPRDYDAPLGDYAYGVPQLLRLMNSTLPEACDQAAKELVKTGNREKVIDQMYLASLSRHPTADETQKINAFLAKPGEPVKGYSAVLWALLNSAEFYNNH